MASVLGMDKQRREEIDVLDIQLATVTGEQIATTVLEWQFAADARILAVGGPLPPFEVPVKVSSRVVDHEALSSLVTTTSTDRCLEVSQRVPSQRVGSEIETDREERRATRIEPSR